MLWSERCEASEIFCGIKKTSSAYRYEAEEMMIYGENGWPALFKNTLTTYFVTVLDTRHSHCCPVIQEDTLKHMGAWVHQSSNVWWKQHCNMWMGRELPMILCDIGFWLHSNVCNKNLINNRLSDRSFQSWLRLNPREVTDNKHEPRKWCIVFSSMILPLMSNKLNEMALCNLSISFPLLPQFQLLSGSIFCRISFSSPPLPFSHSFYSSLQSGCLPCRWDSANEPWPVN